jgi:LPS O-antigen subunit length determinant protein (WzzB/FepE family)
MKPTSKEVLEKISKHCSNELTLYKFNTTTLEISDKYREGRLTALEYLGELSYHYLQEEKKIQEQFKEQVTKQLKLHSCLDDTEYKRGLYDALNEVLHL